MQARNGFIIMFRTWNCRRNGARFDVQPWPRNHLERTSSVRVFTVIQCSIDFKFVMTDVQQTYNQVKWHRTLQMQMSGLRCIIHLDSKLRVHAPLWPIRMSKTHGVTNEMSRPSTWRESTDGMNCIISTCSHLRAQTARWPGRMTSTIYVTFLKSVQNQNCLVCKQCSGPLGWHLGFFDLSQLHTVQVYA